MTARYRENNLKVGILHAGGPAPGGNQVLYAAALRARDHDLPLLAFMNGYQHLITDSTEEVAQKRIIRIGSQEIRYLRDHLSLLPGSARANPAKEIKNKADLNDPQKTAKLTHVLDTLEAMRIGCLISVGGDDTMRTANLLQTHLDNLNADGANYKNFRGIVHVPKTIDKDYPGIDFTFGFMSAAKYIGSRIKGLHDDAKATASRSLTVYHVAEIMGRAAGWLCGAASIYGQSTFAIVPEDFGPNEKVTLDSIAEDCVKVILTRRKQRKHFGVITIAEGLGELILRNQKVEKDEFGHMRLDTIELAAQLKHAIKKKLDEKAGIKAKIHSHTTGYEARQVEPNMFDTLLCQRLGVSAVDAVIQEKYGHMVSVSGVFNPRFVPFEELVNPKTLVVNNWVMGPDEGLYGLLQAMQQPFVFDR